MKVKTFINKLKRLNSDLNVEFDLIDKQEKKHNESYISSSLNVESIKVEKYRDGSDIITALVIELSNESQE